MIKQLVKLGEVTNEKEFSFDDGISRNLKDFILSFPYIYFKSGVWNKYTKVTPEKAIELCNNSLYVALVQNALFRAVKSSASSCAIG